LVLEGVHLLPEIPEPNLREDTIDVQVLLTVRDEQAHRAHFHMRGTKTPRSPERYLEAFDRIRVLQDYLIERATAARIPIIDEGGGRPRRHHPADLRPGARAGERGGGLGRRPEHGRRRSCAFGAARARDRQGSVLERGPQGDARAPRRGHPREYDTRLLVEPG